MAKGRFLFRKETRIFCYENKVLNHEWTQIDNNKKIYDWCGNDILCILYIHVPQVLRVIDDAMRPPSGADGLFSSSRTKRFHLMSRYP